MNITRTPTSHDRTVITAIVIVCGTAASGAALHTATGAAQLGYKIVLPVDCVPGASLFEEQAAVWSLLNGPGTTRVTTATTLDAIQIEKP